MNVKGKEIAKILQSSHYKWTTDELHQNGAYCVLGQIAAKNGIRTTVLDWFDATDQGYSQFTNLGTLIGINDDCDDKNEVVKTLRKEYANTNFGVEKFVEKLCSAQKKNLHRKREDE